MKNVVFQCECECVLYIASPLRETNNPFARPLKQSLIVPPGIQRSKVFSPSIVLPQKHNLKGEDLRYYVRSYISFTKRGKRKKTKKREEEEEEEGGKRKEKRGRMYTPVLVTCPNERRGRTEGRV